MNTQDAPRIILVTGCTRGLGRALTERWAAEGHTLVGCGRSEAPLAALREQLGEPHHFSAVDVADFDAVSSWAARVIDAVGVPHLLINNAALINERAPLWKVPVDEFADILDVNLKGVHHVVCAFTAHMIQAGRGVIVNLSSGWGKFSAPDVGPYCTTKFGIEGYTGSLAEDLPEGLAAIPLQPGIIHTEMLDTAFGAAAEQHWTPAEWIDVAAPFILGLGPEHNGQSLRIPDA
ncbi:MAG: SDR family oxidoreductase [Thermoanaerobaculia bacterium]|nr:SDR family oxidoreductase [Thermoanaerobaculia bacterium]